MEKYKLNDKEFQSKNSQITGKEILESGNFKPATDYELLIKISEKGFEPIQLDEKVDLTNPGIEGFYAKLLHKISVTLDGEKLVVHDISLTPNKILKLAGIDNRKFFLKQLVNEGEIGYKHDAEDDIIMQNGQTFISAELIICIEDHCANDIPIPSGCKYEIRVDSTKFIVESESLTGKEILILAGKLPYERFQLNQKFKGGRVKKVSYDEVVDFTCPGVERFMTLPLDQTEG